MQPTSSELSSSDEESSEDDDSAFLPFTAAALPLAWEDNFDSQSWCSLQVLEG